MELNQLKEYLKAAISLESAIMACELSRDKTLNEIRNLENTNIYVPDPQYPSQPPEPHKGEVPQLKSVSIGISWFSFPRIILALFVGSLIATCYLRLTFGTSYVDSFDDNVPLLLSIGYISAILFYIAYSYIIMQRERKEQYNKELNLYQENELYKDQVYQNNLATWQATTNQISNNYHALKYAAETALTKCNKQKNESITVYHHLNDKVTLLKERLAKLYSDGPLYPAYQNLIAVTQIYEYLASGIAVELEGPTGAYAQYMNDVRAARVCESLEKIREDMNHGFATVAANQRLLLEELKSCTEALNDLNGVMSNTNNQLYSQLDHIGKTINASCNYTRNMADDIATIQNNMNSIEKNSQTIAWNTAINNINQYVDMKSRGIDGYYGLYAY